MAGDTVHIGRKHEAGRVRDAYPSRPAVQLPWTKMHLLAVALVTIGGGVSEGGNRSDFVPKKGMAARALDLMVGHVLPMHELGGILGRQ